MTPPNSLNPPNPTDPHHIGRTRSGPVAVALTGLSAALLAIVAVVPPATAYVICGALLGASATAVGFALVGWGACSGRAAGGRT